MPLHVSSTMWSSVLSQPAHGTATYVCDDTRGCIIQFRPPDDEHMCSKHVETWNKLIVNKFKFKEPPPDIHPQDRTTDPRLKLVTIDTTATMCQLATGRDGPEIESWWGRDFPHLWAHSASCTMGTGSFPGVKSGRGVTLTPSPPSSAVVKKE